MASALNILDVSTVLPHLQAVYDFDYSSVWSSGGHTLLSLHPTTLCGILCIFWMISCWVLSIISGNVSQVDRLWSIAPPLYTWIYFWSLPYPYYGSKFSLEFIKYVAQQQPRFFLLLLLPTFWGLRLTYNFWRKGGYKWKEEDYRWRFVRQEIVGTGLIFHLFNIFFISIYQHILLFWIVFPIHFAYDGAIDRYNSALYAAPLSNFDLAAGGLFIFFQLIEIIADQQQFAFYTRRTALRAGKLYKSDDVDGDLSRGFLASKGLFRFCRHPNFFAEQCMWWSYSIFALQFFQSPYINISTLGALQLSSLFHGSTNFTEKITAKKYIYYRDYQRAVSRLLPWIPRKVQWGGTIGAAGDPKKKK